MFPLRCTAAGFLFLAAILFLPAVAAESADALKDIPHLQLLGSELFLIIQILEGTAAAVLKMGAGRIHCKI